MTLDAWREIVLGEEAAVYAYGVLAAQLVEPDKSRAIDAGVAHARARGRAREELAAEDADPPAPAAFHIPFPMNGPDDARRLAVLVENRLVEVYCRQTPELAGGARKYAARTAQECATRAIVWGGDTAAFPGRANVTVTTTPEPSAPTQSVPADPTPATPSPSLPPSGSDGAVVQ